MKIKHKRVISVVLSLAMAAVSLPGQAMADVTVRSTETVNQMATDPELVFVNSFQGAERSENFDDHWKFYLGEAENAQSVMYNDSMWRQVNLPHDYSIEQEFTKSGEAESGYLPGGTGWYRKNFLVPRELEGKRLRIDFGGAYMNSSVWINGHKLGTHPYGYTPFSYDLTEYINFGGDNVIAVKTENKIPSSRWYSGSGIYRSVELTVMNPVHVDLYGTQITTPNLEAEYNAGDDVTAQIDTTVRNDGTETEEVTVKHTFYKKGEDTAAASGTTEEIAVPAGESVKIPAQIPVSAPELWSVDDPNLYTVRTEVMVGGETADSYETEYGFRWFQFGTDDGFSLNGKNMKLKGVCMHHDQGALGAAAYRRAIERQVDILKDMGCNSIRVTHNPADESLIEICNEKGILLIEEAFDTWLYAKNGNSNDYGKWFNTKIESGNTIEGGKPGSMTWAEFDLKTMVSRGKNAPSIIMWSMGNEVMEGIGGDTSNYPNVLKKLIGWVEEVDTTRAVTTGENKLKADWQNAAQMADILTEAGGTVGFNYAAGGKLDEYHAKYPDWAMYGSETASAVNSRGIYNPNGYQGGTQKGQQLTSYDKSAVGWGHCASDAWYTVLTRNYMAGEYVWTGFDYIGEPTPWNGTGSGAVGTWPSPKSSYFGIIDTAGFPKDSYYLYRSLWNETEPTLHILPAWKGNLVAKDSEGKVKVVVYTNAAAVELFYVDPAGNRTSQGKKAFTRKYTENDLYSYQIYEGDGKSGKEHENLYLTWDVPYADGSLEAVAYDENNNVIETESVNTTGEARALALSADRDTIQADGKDLCYITVDVKDENGNIVPDAADRIQFQIEGDGEIAGVDNGNSTDHDSYQADNRKAFGGKALVIVRSTKKGGSFTLTATANGLESDTITVTTSEVEKPDTGKQITSYLMSKNYYVKTGNEPVLPAEVTVNYSDGTEETLAVTWDSMNPEDIEKAGTYALYGVTEMGLPVSVNINMIDEIAALLNYSTAVPIGTPPVLPEARPAVMADGTVLEVQFPVTWDDVPDSEYDRAGQVTVAGKAVVMGKEINVTATVRVSEEQISIGANVASRYLTLEQNVPKDQQSDTLTAITNGSITADPNLSGGTNPSVWTDWEYAQDGNRNPEITFTYATAQNLGRANIYFFTDSGSARLPEKVELYYSLDPTQDDGWKKIEARLETATTEADRVTRYTFDFTPVNAVGFKIAITDARESGTSQKPCTGITETELFVVQGSFQVGTTAKLKSLTVNDETVEEAVLKKGSYSTPATLIETLEATAADNAATTILPAFEDEVRILIESEDHNAKSTFTIYLNGEGEGTEDRADDSSRDYPYGKTSVEVPNFQPGLPGEQAIDDDASTIWHTLWSRTTPEDERWITLTLEEETLLDAVRYLPKQGSAGGDSNGRVGDYRVEVKTDDTDWTVVSSGNWADTNAWKLAKFDEPVEAKYVRLRGITTYGDGAANKNKFMNTAEIRVRKAKIAEDISGGDITLSETEFKENGAPITPLASVTVDGTTLRNGIDYKLSYKDNVEPGTATVTATGIIKYKGKLTTTFTIVEHNRQNITVINGEIAKVDGEIYEGGSSAALVPGKTVEIRADEPQEGMRFDHWKTAPETLVLADQKSARTTFKVSDSAARITAVYVNKDGEQSQAEVQERVIPGSWFAFTEPDDLEGLLENPAIITESDKNGMDRGDKVKLTQSIEKKEKVTASASNAIREEAGVEEEGRELGYFVATRLAKSVSRSNGSGSTTETIASPSEAIRITMELPKADRDMTDYMILAYEKNEEEESVYSVDFIKEGDEITFNARTDGLYGLAYTKCYTVTFQDYDGTVLGKLRVTHGEKAEFAYEPERPGYTFVNWSKELDSITKDMTVKAVYEKNSSGEPEEPENPADHSKLDAKIKEVRRFLSTANRSDYTTASYERLLTVLETAVELDENATQKEVDTTLAALKKAYAGLVKRPAGSGSGGSSGGGSSSSRPAVSDKNVAAGGSAASGITLGTWQAETDGRWKLILPSGKAAANQWLKLMWNNEAKWYYFGSDGYMKEGWFTDTDGYTYYLHAQPDGSRGYMYTGWNWIKGADGIARCYYFSQTSDGTQGHLVKNGVTPDGYTVDQDGAWVLGNTVQMK